MKILSLRTSDPWCSAQQIGILMLDSGKHTMILCALARNDMVSMGICYPRWAYRPWGSSTKYRGCCCIFRAAFSSKAALLISTDLACKICPMA